MSERMVIYCIMSHSVRQKQQMITCVRDYYRYCDCCGGVDDGDRDGGLGDVLVLDQYAVIPQ